MLYSLTTRIALVFALAVTGARPAGAADQTILGRQLVVKNPLGEAASTGKRQLVVKAREIGSPDTIVGDPTAAGASLSIMVNGGTPSMQTFALPAAQKRSHRDALLERRCREGLQVQGRQG